MAVAGGTQNRDLAEDGVQGLISPLTGKQVCPSALDPGPPWSPCHPCLCGYCPKGLTCFSPDDTPTYRGLCPIRAFSQVTHPTYRLLENSAPAMPSLCQAPGSPFRAPGALRP